MKNKPTIIVAGEPNSIFLEIFFKSIKLKKYKNPLILICSSKLLKLQMKKLRFKKKIKILNPSNINPYNLDNNKLLKKTLLMELERRNFQLSQTPWK